MMFTKLTKKSRQLTHKIRTSDLKKLASLFTLLLLCMLGFAQTLPVPQTPARLVNDFAGILNPQEAAALESKLVAFDDSTTNQIAVITVKSLEGFDISDYAIKTFQKWKIGAAKKNNGILVLVSAAEHKVWIAVGNGLEPVVTDALSRRIVDNTMIPAFRQNQYYAGLDAGTTQLMQYASGEFHDKRPRAVRSRGNTNWFFLIIIIVFILIAITRGGGGGPGQHISGGGSNWPLWMLLGGVLGSGGRNEGWGGGNDSGGFGGGGDSGGFGGFSGGDTGGGGAGGSW